MSEIDEIVSGSITADTTTTPREGFGVQIGMAANTPFDEAYRDYTATNDMLSDGYTKAHPHYRMASAAFKQSPRPKFFRAGRVSTKVAHTVKLTVTASTDGKVASVLVTDGAGVEHAVSHTLSGSEGAAGAATAIGAAIGALAGVTSATVTGADIVVTIATAGDVWFYDSLVGMDYLDETPTASIDTDLAAIMDLDDSFYYVTIAYGSKANFDDVDDWCETNKKFFGLQTADSREKRAGTSVVGADLKSKKLTHTMGLFHSKPKEFAMCAWIGLLSAKDPGSATFANKQLAGASMDGLSKTEKNALVANGLNYYVKAGNRGVTRKDGTVGSGEKADVIVGIDWLDNEIKASVFDDIAKKDKVNMDDGGIAEIQSVILGVLKLGVRRNFLAVGNGADIPAPKVEPLAVSDIPQVDRDNRLLSGVKWSARMTNAIHAVDYTGSLTN